MDANSGDFSDGSGASDYPNNAKCQWIIAPDSALRVLLHFTEFNTEDKDIVSVYECSTIDCLTQKQLAVLSGTNVLSSAVFTSSTGIMKVTFTSDSSMTAAGFKASYTAVSICFCSAVETFAELFCMVDAVMILLYFLAHATYCCMLLTEPTTVSRNFTTPVLQQES
jgi:hypothetical protein